LPCTPKGIIYLLQHYKINLSGKNVVIIGRSLIVGKPLSMLMSNFDASVTLLHSKSLSTEVHTKNADLIVTAIGHCGFLKKSHLNPNKKTILIDVGINRLNNQWVGDVDHSDLKNENFIATPVPGGIGPMT